jgi:putative hydrolase of the HAD superfamily
MPAGRSQRNAVLLDALGTLVQLDEPWPALVRLLDERYAIHISLEAARAALLDEMAHYRSQCIRAGDEDSLAALRLECAEILRRGLYPALQEIDSGALVALLLDSLHFRAYDDVRPALERWRAAGLARIVVSNWDISLHTVLANTGLLGLLDGVVCSAELGASKPDPAPFRAALELAGLPAEQVVHIGDSLDEDVAGAHAAGIEPVLIHRGAGAVEPPDGVRVIASLREW